MSFILVKDLKVKDYVNYGNNLYSVKNINTNESTVNVTLRGVYLPNTIINLIMGLLSKIEVVNPEIFKYKIIGWKGGDQFEISNDKEKIIMNIPENSQKISYDFSIGKKVYVEICRYNNVNKIFSIY